MMVIAVLLVIIGLGALLAFLLLLTARQATRKVVVLDVLTTISTGVLVALSYIFDTAFLLDIALIYAILSFAAVLLVARYLERGL